MKKIYLSILLLVFNLTINHHIWSQCNNAFAFGGGAAPTGGSSLTMSTCNWAGDYSTVTTVAAATNYRVNVSVATTFVTVRQGTPGGAVIAFGVQPLNWTSTVAGTYYIHYNTNAACGTASTCLTTTLTHIACVVAAPTAVSATPTSMCAGLSSNLRATSAGNTIRWYTVATGGTNIGTSASGANFAVSPIATTTYYAEAYAAAGCASATRTAVTVTITAGPAAPTAVSATPATVCPNATSNLRATSAGNTIRWYTVATGGTNIGTSASGANFAVVPLATTTYYAEAYTAGGCISTTRTAVTVNTSTAPAAPTNVTATPPAICLGASSNISAVANSTGFTGVYAPASWTQTNEPGDVGSASSAGAPNSISVTSGSNFSGSFSSVFYTVNITTTGTLTFNWSYTTTDIAASYDYPQYAINGVIIGLVGGFSGFGATTQSGTASIAVTAGQTFSFVMTTSDNSGGVGTTVFSNFSGPGNGTNTINWYNAASGGTFLANRASGANYLVTPVTTTTYYAETSTGVGCPSGSRTPVTVTIDIPALPSSVTATPATICVGASTNLSAVSSASSGIISGFSSMYAPSNWTISHNPATDAGTVNTSGAPASISITSSNGGNSGNHSVLYTVTAAGTGNITFDWSYVSTDVNGSNYDIPQYAINGVIIGNVPGFTPILNGGAIQSGSATIPILAGQTFSLVMTAIDDILGAATTVFTNFTAPGPIPNPITWFTTPTGGTSIGTSASGANFPVTPGSTITYYAESTSPLGCVSAARTAVTVTVNTYSTDPVMAGLSSSYCPNTNITLSAGGGTAGSGSNIYWYTGPNGTGSLVGTGASIVVAPSATTTYYVRRQGTCNNSNDDVDVVVLKNYIYAANGTSTSTYCTDNAGWNHFYVGNDIILSVLGNLSSAGTVTATIRDNGAYYLDPGTPALCASGLTPGEAQFEMERNWNVGYTGSLIGSYDVRYYFQPAERTNVINAANAWIAANPACSYTYKYTINPSGWFWFKNQGTAYTAPDYDDDATFTMLSSGGTGATPNGINYAIMAGVTSFSGGTGGVILIPDPLLNTAWLYFEGETNNKTNFLRWATESEQNTAHFNIQRSKDGVSFTSIGTVGAQGNSTTTHHYTFDDETPFTGDNYYRLELVGTDAKISYSNTIRLVIADDGRGYSFYPNPTQNIVNYQYEATEKAPLEIEVIDVYGRTLSKRQVTTQVGLNRIPVNLSEFAAGAYMIRVNHLNSGNVHVNKVILDK